MVNVRMKATLEEKERAMVALQKAAQPEKEVQETDTARQVKQTFLSYFVINLFLGSSA